MGSTMLKTIGEKVLHVRSNPGLLAYSPTIDLLAVGFPGEGVHVFRLNGQAIQQAHRKNLSEHVDRLAWKQDGKLLATANSNGVIDMCSVEGFKLVHSFPAIPAQCDVVVTCLVWTSSSTLDFATSLESSRHEASWTQPWEKLDVNQSLDLPRDLMFLDIETSLPKLSVLPFGSTDGLFDTRESVDSLFESHAIQGGDVVDILLVGTEDGRIAVRLFDTFSIGDFPVPMLPGHSGATSNIISHAGHKRYSSHALLVQSGRKLSFVTLDLRFVRGSESDIALLASKATTLQDLFRYIDQVRKSIISQFASSQDLPNRFLSSINEEMVKNNKPPIMQAMYHSVVTGHTFPEAREWLIDELRERGHTRWDKAVTAGLSAVVKLVHENMLPALERYSLVLSRFLGIARFQQRRKTAGFGVKDIERLMDLTECLKLVSHRILVYASNELDLFSAFSIWMRHEIDRLSATNSSDLDEFAEKEAAMDHSKILQYIELSTKPNMIAPFLSPGTDNGDFPSFENVSEHLQSHEMGSSNPPGSMCTLDDLCRSLDNSAQHVFSQIAETEKRNVSFGQYIELEPKMQDTLNVIRLVPEDSSHFSTFIITAFSGGHTLKFVEIRLEIFGGISKVQSKRTAECDLGQGSVIDVAFLDDDDVLILWKTKSSSITTLKVLKYRANEALTYQSDTTTRHDMISDIKDDARSYALPDTANFEPATLEVRKSENADSVEHVRICVLNRLRSAYKVYALTSSFSSTTGRGKGIEDGDAIML